MDCYTNLNEIIQQLEACHYECEAGPLENNVAWIELRAVAEICPDPIRTLAVAVRKLTTDNETLRAMVGSQMPGRGD